MRKLSSPIRFFLLLVFVISFLQTGLFAQTRLLPDPGPTLAGRFGRVPAPGVHPRVLFGPDELVRMRLQVKSTEVGKFTIGRVEQFLGVIHTPGKQLAETYAGLLKGDVNATTSVKDPFWQNKITLALMLESYDALLREDQAKGQQAGAALATIALIPRNWASNESDILFFSLAYDFDYGYMSEAQRRAVRQAIATGTANRKTYGADFPADWQNYNWVPRGMNLVISALAIEGEQGYDASIYAPSLQVMKNFLH